MPCLVVGTMPLSELMFECSVYFGIRNNGVIWVVQITRKPYVDMTCWRHQMETFSAWLAFCAEYSPVTGDFPAQGPVTQSFDTFIDLRLNNRLTKQSWGWWSETPSNSLWRHWNEKREYVQVIIGKSFLVFVKVLPQHEEVFRCLGSCCEKLMYRFVCSLVLKH